jgi:hypothetical protein
MISNITARSAIVAAIVVMLVPASASTQEAFTPQAVPSERRPMAVTPMPTQNPEGQRSITQHFEQRSTPQAFSVVLVLGDMQSAAAQDNVPPAARKALADVKDFLPYKGYRLLDVQWTLCCGRSSVLSRLRGPDEQEYDLELNPSGAGGSKWYVRFSLRPSIGSGVGGRGEAANTPEITDLTAQAMATEQQLATLRTRYNDNHPEVVSTRAKLERTANRIAELRKDQELKKRGLMPGAAGTRAIIDTSFTMEVGETVVVGSSSLKGDKALIALLTAVPQHSTTNVR